MVKTGLIINLTEPQVFLRGPATGEDSRGRRAQVREDGPPALLRGVLTLNLSKPSRIKRIDLTLEGKTRTEWPEGIGARRTEIFEEHNIFEATTNLFAVDRSHSNARRAASVGPGVLLDDEDFLRTATGGRQGANIDSSASSRRVSIAAGLTTFGQDEEHERGRGREGRGGMRSFSAMPISAVPSRLHSPDRSHGSSSPSSLSGAPYSNQVDTQAARLKLEAQESYKRGPSPAYTPHPEPHNHHVPNGASPSTDAPSHSAPLGGPTSVLSPIMSADPSPYQSRDSSQPEEGVERRPVRPSIPQHVSAQSTTSSSGEGRSSTEEEEPSRATTPTQTDTVNPSPPHTFNQYEMSTVMENVVSPTRVSSALPSAPASPLPSTSILLQEPPVVSASSSHPSSVRSRHSLSHEFNPTSGESSPSLRNNHLLPQAEGESSSRRSSRDMSPFTHRPDLLTHSSGGSSTKRAESRSRSSRFNFAGVTSALRSMSKDIKDRVTHAPHHPSGSHSGHASSQASLTDGANGPVTGFGGSGTGGFGPSSNDEFVPSYGRGGAGSSTTGRGRRESPERERAGSRSASRSRGRNAGLKVLNTAAGGLFTDDVEGEAAADEEGHSWKEFRKGTYHYPISFTIPSTTPPTIHADFGHVVYKLKAVVYRSGALTTNLYEEKEVRMVACPGEDDTEESENVIVERQWEDQLRYLVALSGKSFPIGGNIPISIRLMPFEKMKIYRISVVLEEKIDYYAYDKKVARHESVRRHQLLGLKNAASGKTVPALLPITSDAPDAVAISPLTPYAIAALEAGADVDDATSSLLNATGPWHFDADLHVPDCNSRIHFTTKHAKTNMTVGHCLKIIFRVERGDDTLLDAKGKRKQFDIIIETPVTILDCRCNVQFIALPSYTNLVNGDREDVMTSSCTCRTAAERRSASPATPKMVPMPEIAGPSLPPPAFGGSAGPLPSSLISRTVGTGHHSPSPHRRTAEDDEADAAYEASDQYARLVSGEETAVGMIPPSYEDVLGGRNHSGTITTRTRDASSRSASRQPRSASRDDFRSRSRSRVGIVTTSTSSSRDASPMRRLR